MTKGNTLVSKGDLFDRKEELVMEGKTLVTEGNILVNEGKTLKKRKCSVSSHVFSNVRGSERKVFVPRIILIPKPGECQFEWWRSQFPVKPA